ncbi:hypothetical protein [Paenibacillus amylolyticus]|uniref:Helix-turn-helix domain-containing protein n=1 Tax=Paenibacillus amylolyticus TaxID=1451 RepID=A0A124DYN7_PAEAM|nr:hypothetical protein [Paenibacillus amylolyticus]GAS84769.1 helix-turn-helix domain-containing protein [Paenibacillus amylolyticus]
MKLAPTIRTYIENHMREHGFKLQQFSDITGVNVGTLSAILKGSRPMAVSQLDQITAGMGLEKGYFYEMYSVEFFIEAAPHWRRLKPFLHCCAEFNKLACIQKVVIQVTDDRSYISELFEMAEEFNKNGLSEAALILYECVAEGEKYQHSERLALCQYRIFLLHKTIKQFDNLSAAIKFEPYIEKLDEEIQLDAIKDLANVYNTIHHWDKVDKLADALERKVDFQLELQSRRRKNIKRVAFYPIFTYKAYANLLKASVCEARKEFEKALEYTDIYAKVVEVSNPTEEEQILIDRFKGWAEGNRYLYRLSSGKHEVIEYYLDYLESNPHEILIAFVNIVQSANQHLLNIDFALDRFDSYITDFNTERHLEGTYNQQMLNHRYIRFYYELAKYRLHQQKYMMGIEALLTSLELASSSRDDLMSIKLIDLYGKFRSQATIEQEELYTGLLTNRSIENYI